MGHQRMANIQFVDALDRRDRFDVVVMQTVTGIHDQALGQAKRDAISNSLQFFCNVARGLCIGVTAGVQFDSRCSDTFGRRDLPLIRVDE